MRTLLFIVLGILVIGRPSLAIEYKDGFSCRTQFAELTLLDESWQYFTHSDFRNFGDNRPASKAKAVQTYNDFMTDAHHHLSENNVKHVFDSNRGEYAIVILPEGFTRLNEGTRLFNQQNTTVELYPFLKELGVDPFGLLTPRFPTEHDKARFFIPYDAVADLGFNDPVSKKLAKHIEAFNREQKGEFDSLQGFVETVDPKTLDYKTNNRLIGQSWHRPFQSFLPPLDVSVRPDARNTVDFLEALSQRWVVLGEAQHSLRWFDQGEPYVMGEKEFEWLKQTRLMTKQLLIIINMGKAATRPAQDSPSFPLKNSFDYQGTTFRTLIDIRSPNNDGRKYGFISIAGPEGSSPIAFRLTLALFKPPQYQKLSDFVFLKRRLYLLALAIKQAERYYDDLHDYSVRIMNVRGKHQVRMMREYVNRLKRSIDQ